MKRVEKLLSQLLDRRNIGEWWAYGPQRGPGQWCVCLELERSGLSGLPDHEWLETFDGCEVRFANGTLTATYEARDPTPLQAALEKGLEKLLGPHR